MRMGMANTNYRMTAIQVKVLFPFVIPYVRAFGFFDDDVIDRINVKEFHCTKGLSGGFPLRI